MNMKLGRRASAGTLTIALGVLIGALLQGGFLTVHSALGAVGATDPVVESATLRSSALEAALDLSTAFADLAAHTTPAVVQIVVTGVSPEASLPELPRDVPESFRRFFQPGAPDARERLVRASGSGFVVTADGYVVTNDHVVGDADRITVELSDHRSFEADLVGSDPTTDIAVIKIDATELPYLEWGSSADLRVGSWVMAVGNPGIGTDRLESTVTTGIVSAKGRPLQLIGQGLSSDPRYGPEAAGYAIENFIQTDAVINPGNSGGPMVDLRGRVVGMNSAIASTDGRYQGYGFAIPSDLVRKVAGDLIVDGTVHRPWLGVQVGPVGAEDAEAYQLPAVSGVLVQGVTPDSPAAESGLQPGDVIVSVDGRGVTSGGDLQERIAVLDPGAKARIGLYRGGALRSVEVRLGSAPKVGARRAPSSIASRRTELESLGLTVEPLDGATARDLGFPSAGGVLISDVAPASPAADRGLTPGLRLQRVGAAEVATPADVAEALAAVPSGGIVTLLVEAPSGQTRIVNVRKR